MMIIQVRMYFGIHRKLRQVNNKEYNDMQHRIYYTDIIILIMVIILLSCDSTHKRKFSAGASYIIYGGDKIEMVVIYYHMGNVTLEELSTLERIPSLVLFKSKYPYTGYCGARVSCCPPEFEESFVSIENKSREIVNRLRFEEKCAIFMISESKYTKLKTSSKHLSLAYKMINGRISDSELKIFEDELDNCDNIEEIESLVERFQKEGSQKEGQEP